MGSNASVRRGWRWRTRRKVVAITIAAVAHAIDPLRPGLQDEARPQSVPAIAGAARRPMQAVGSTCTPTPPSRSTPRPSPRLGPRAQGCCFAGWCHCRAGSAGEGESAAAKGAERRHIHVIVVIVRNKDDVDGRQRVEGDAGRVHPSRPPRTTAGWRAFRPNGIEKDVAAARLIRNEA